jgi:hypothetical protein
VGKRGQQTNGSVAAHPEIADIVEKNGCCRGVGLDWFQQ